MGRALKLGLPAALLLAALVVFAVSCGRGNHQVAHETGGLEIYQPDGLTAAPTETSTNDALAELEVLQCPEGVDAALWAELKSALQTELTESRPGSPARLLSSSEDSGAKAPRTGAVVNHGRDPAIAKKGAGKARPTKSTSAPPTGDQNRINDLAITDNGDGTFTLTWHYRNLGDYDQNGTVAVEDIIPLAEHFGQTWAHGEEHSLTAVVDGSGNGRVGIEDITPIAANIDAGVDHYTIEGSADEEGSWVAVGEVAQSQSSGDGRPVYEHILSDATHRWYRVVPSDSESILGEPSANALSPLFQEWVHTWGGSDEDYGCGVWVDASGSVYVSGYSWSPGVDFIDLLLLKYSPSGTLQWQRTWGGSNSEFGADICLDGSGDIYVAGSTFSFGAGDRDFLILKYSAEGELLWQRTWGGSGDDGGCGISIDGTGNVYVTGWTGVFNTPDYDLVLIKCSPGGELLWLTTWSGVQRDEWDIGYGVAADESGNAYVTGYTRSSAGGGTDMLLLKYSPSGELLWQTTWGGGGAEGGLAVDGNGFVYVTTSAYNWDTETSEVVLLKYSSSGELRWQKGLGGVGMVSGQRVSLDMNGSIYISGQMIGPPADHLALLLLKYSADGELIWQEAWDGKGNDYGHDLAVDGSGRLYLAGWSPNNYGYWWAPEYSAITLSGTEVVPEGAEDEPEWIETEPEGTEGELKGVEDEGGGEADALIMKIDPSRW